MDQLSQLTQFSWSIIAVLALTVAAAMIIYLVRAKEQKSATLDEVAGVLKQDWARTGKIDFHVVAPDSAAPQRLILRVEEKKIIENPMGEDVVKLRWRVATVDEAKEVVVCWNKCIAEDRLIGRKEQPQRPIAVASIRPMHKKSVDNELVAMAAAD